jgi:hypothetical protein
LVSGEVKYSQVSVIMIDIRRHAEIKFANKALLYESSLRFSLVDAILRASNTKTALS